MSAAIRFSKPSPARSEYGRSFGSAQTRSSRAAAGCAMQSVSATANATARRSGQREDIEHPALRRLLLQVGNDGREAAAGAFVARIEVAGDDAARPAADARQHGDVLPVFGAAIRHRLADDPRARLEFPELIAGLRVDRLEPAFHRAVEDDV